MIYWQLFVLVSASIRVPYRAYISRDLNFANDSNIGFRGSYFREKVPAHNKCLLRDFNFCEWYQDSQNSRNLNPTKSIPYTELNELSIRLT